jgi:hypothetical protein
VTTEKKNLAPTGTRSPKLLACSESLFGLPDDIVDRVGSIAINTAEGARSQRGLKLYYLVDKSPMRDNLKD